MINSNGNSTGKLLAQTSSLKKVGLKICVSITLQKVFSNGLTKLPVVIPHLLLLLCLSNLPPWNVEVRHCLLDILAQAAPDDGVHIEGLDLTRVLFSNTAQTSLKEEGVIAMGETTNLDHMMSVSYSCLPTFLYLTWIGCWFTDCNTMKKSYPKQNARNIMQTIHHNEPLTRVASLSTTVSQFQHGIHHYLKRMVVSESIQVTPILVLDLRLAGVAPVDVQLL